MLALCAGLPFGVAAQGTSGLLTLDDRNALLGWEAVGRLDMKGVGFCTGALIAPDLVLTAAHCVYNARTGERVSPDKLTFRAGYNFGSSIAERGVKRFVTLPQYNPHARNDSEQARYDVALLELESRVSSTDANPFALHEGPTHGMPVSVVSYGKGRSESLSWQKSCRELGRRDGLIGFDCDVTFGSSGSPVFVKTGNRVRILSVVSMMGETADGKIAVGMDLDEPVAALKARMRNTRGTPNAAIRRITVGDGRISGGSAKFVKP